MAVREDVMAGDKKICQPLVSVCIPAYNSSATIAETIQSVLDQTYRNIELVVVDDNSKDNTVSLVERFIEKDGRVRLYRNEQNLGMSGNWNHCLELCQGEYVKLICADDQIEPEAIEREAKAMLEHPFVNLVESDTRLVDVNGKTTGAFKRYYRSGVVNGKKVAKTSLMLNNFFGAPVNNLVRRSVLERTGLFDTSFTYILDFDMWVRIACAGDVYILHEPLNRFMVRNDSNTGVMIGQKRDVYVAEHRKLVEKHAAAGVLRISKFEVELSVLLRKLRNVMIGIYLRIFAK